MSKNYKEFCSICGEYTEFTYDGEQWVCQKCGNYDTRGEFNESLPPVDHDED